MNQLRPALSLLLLLVPALAQETRALPRVAEDLLPASTYATWRFGGLAACRAAASAQPLTALIESTLATLPADVKESRIDAPLDFAANEFASQLDDQGVKVGPLRAALGQPMTLALGRLALEGMGPSVALVVDIGDQRRAINQIVQFAAQSIAADAGGADTREETIGGFTFHAMTPDDGPSLFAGAIGSLYVISNSRGFLAEMADVAAGKKRSLAQATPLGGLRARLGAPAAIEAFVHVARLWDAIAPHLPYEWDALADLLGLGAIDAVYGGYAPTAEGGADLVHLGLRGSGKGLLKAMVSAPVDLSFAQACSPNTVLFAAGSFDSGALVDAGSRLLQALPPVWQDRMRGGLELMTLAFDDEADAEAMARAFGPQVGLAISLEKGAVPKPELVVRVGVRDAARVAALLRQFEADSARDQGAEWKVRKVDGKEIRYTIAKAEGAPLQLSPCYALVDGGLWLASDVMALVRTLRPAEDAPPLAAEPDVQQLAGALDGASGVLHWRLHKLIELGWVAVEANVAAALDAQKDELGFGSEALPDAEALAQAFGATSWLLRVGDDGVTVRGRGQMTFGSLCGVLGLALDGFLARASKPAKPR
ncbi:MAG: hypothetical protein FJ301_02860 [Planctomycetes bacterium]|nr:hypothetical protein [Planctomycetota bacterium]